MKFSEEIGKITIPGPKSVVRVYDDKGPVFDLLCLQQEVANLPQELTYYTEKTLDSKMEKFTATNIKLVTHELFSKGKRVLDQRPLADSR